MKKRHERQAFRGHVGHGEAFALDPQGSGLIARAVRGEQPAPHAFGFFCEIPPPLEYKPDAVRDGLAVLDLRGPLEHHASWLWHSYSDLLAQAERAFADQQVELLVLRIDSPGGVCAGMGEAHKELRRLRALYDKPLLCYVDQMACSAAYCVASACDEIWTPNEAQLGSIGVILCTVDETGALEQAGVRVRYVVTGARKADLHPGSAVTDEVLRVAQSKVDYIGTLFFDAVAQSRGMSAPAVSALQANVFHGLEAVEIGLADEIASWNEFLDLAKQAIAANVEPDRATGVPDGTTRLTRAKAATGCAARSSGSGRLSRRPKVR